MVRTRLAVLAAALAALAVAPRPVRADFATTNLQVLEGWSFRDPTTGSDLRGGRMSTVTLNHFSAWRYGDTFAFADLLQGDFRDDTRSHLYAELHPRLFLSRLLGAPGRVLGIFKDAGIATELNLGNGFQAYLAGLGGDLAVPFGTVSVNVYYRYDALQAAGVGPLSTNHTWQLSPSWVIPIPGPVPLLFAGFVDVNGAKAGKGWKGVEVMAQPQLLLDVVALAGGPRSVVLAGVEWYLHSHPSNERLGAPANLVSAPQATLQWNLH